METGGYIFNLYPKMVPLNAKPLPLKCRKSKIDRESHLSKLQVVSSKSLISKYTEICNRNPSKEIQKQMKMTTRGQHSLSSLKDYENGILFAENKNTMTSLRVQNAIQSLQSYSEELNKKMSLQHKNKRKRSLFNSKKHLLDLLPEQSHKERVDENPETSSPRHASLTKYGTSGSNTSMAMKTINILYKAIIDDTIRNRKKEEFEVNANRLPIIDRFRVTNRRQKAVIEQQHPLLKARVKALSDLQQRRTMLSMYQTLAPREKSQQKLQVPEQHIREDIDIVPWTINEERLDV